LFLSRLISMLPLSLAIACGRILGLVFYYVFPIKYKIAYKNLQRAFGNDLTHHERRRIIKACYAQMGMYGMEILRLPFLTPELSHALIETQGYEHLEAAFAKKKGVIIMATHLDNVDYAGCSMALQGIPICVTARELHWKPLNDFVSAVRRRTGVILVPPRRSKEQIYELLRENKAVSFIVDQHAAQYRSIVCEFFGQLASTSHAPARFAYQTGASIIPGLIYRKGNSGQHVVRLEPLFELESPFNETQLNIRHNTERLNRIIEGWIREFPEQWLWFHRRWKVQDHPENWDIPDHLRHLVEVIQEK
jgi:Kdo2-lipid IVA lauroyltransferase/acyltransferase